MKIKNIGDKVKIDDRGDVEFEVCGKYMNERGEIVYEVIEEGDSTSFEVKEVNIK